MNVQRAWLMAFLACMLVGTIRVAQGVERITYGAPIPVPGSPGLFEYFYTITAADAWNCPHAGNYCVSCDFEGCRVTSGADLECVEPYCVSNPLPGSHWTVCSPGEDRDNWECQSIVHNCAIMSQDCANDFFHGLPGSLPPGPRITITPCKDHTGCDTWDSNWRPEYGHKLCFAVVANTDMDARIELRTSTFEGMCMNADVPADDPLLRVEENGVCPDLAPVPWEGGGGLRYESVDIYGIALYSYQIPLIKDQEVDFRFYVQDYAARANFCAYNPYDPSIGAMVYISQSYDNFLTNADGDADGLTDFEEFRGFMTEQYCYADECHMRTNPSTPNLFFDDVAGYGDWAIISAATCYEVNESSIMPFTPIGDRDFIDGMAQTQQGGCQPLCDPGYDPPGNVLIADQAIDWIDVDNDMEYWGITYQYRIGGNPRTLFRGPSGCTEGMRINMSGIQAYVQTLQDPPYYLPPERTAYVEDGLISRVYLHEIGHSLGIPEHLIPAEGEWNCVMKYVTDFDFPPFTTGGWDGWTWGQGYLDDSPNQCASTKGLRP